MIREAIEHLIGQGVKTAAPVTVIETSEYKHVVIGGKLETLLKPPPAREHNVETLDEIIALAKRFEAEKPVVWYSATVVQLVVDDAGHRVDRATLGLVDTNAWETVKGLRKLSWLDQAAFVRLLRIDLAGTIEPFVLLDRVKRLKWQSGGTTDRTVGFGRESLGREIKAEVNAESEIPEVVDLVLRVHSNRGEDTRYAVHCAVEINAPEAKLRIVPLPDEIERIENLVVAGLAERLLERLPESVPCYHGTDC